MELVEIARVLWRRRLVVAVGLLIAIALGFKVGADRTGGGGVATGSVLIDTPRSQLVDTSPHGADSLPWRAVTLSSLMASAAVKRDIARGAGIPDNQLAVLDSDLIAPLVDASLPRTAAKTAGIVREPYGLAVSADGHLPVVSLRATAPTTSEAARLVLAAIAAAKTVPPTSNTLKQQAMVIESTAPVRAHELPGRSRLLPAIGLGLLAFALWCGCVPLIVGLGRFWRSIGPVRAEGRPKLTR